jgi:hypothetical protein
LVWTPTLGMEARRSHHRNPGLGRFSQYFHGSFRKGAIGVTIAGGLLFYVLRPEVRTAFVARRAIER